MADKEKQSNVINGRAPSRELTVLGFVWRFAFALFLVLITYNPSGTSAFHWISTAIGAGELGAIHFFVIALLAIGWTILWVATWRALDTFGVILAAVALGTLVWLLIDFGILAADSGSAVTWIVLVCLASLLGIGLSWSHIWRRLTGQFETDDDN